LRNLVPCRGTARAVLAALLLGLPACHGHRNCSTPASQPAATLSLVGITVSPASPSIERGETQLFTASGTYSDQSEKDVTALVSWRSSSTEVATIEKKGDAGGLATGLSAGSSDIRATLETISGSTTLQVREPVVVSIEVTPPNPSIALGSLQDFKATGTFSDNTTRDVTEEAAWGSSRQEVATISNVEGTRGRAVSVATGTTGISALLDGVTGSTTLTVTAAVVVSIAVTPTNPTIPVGATQQFKATGTLSDKTTQDLTSSATWASSRSEVASVSDAAGSKGEAKGLAAGSSSISAGFQGKSGATTLTVTDAVPVSIAVTPTNQTIVAGTQQQFQATEMFSDATTRDITLQATWSSSDTRVATVGDQAATKGLAQGLDSGDTTIAAGLSGLSGSTTLTVKKATLLTITVSPANPSIALGNSQPFTASGSFDNGTTQDLTTTVTWSSSATGVATVSNAAGSKGLATSVSTGTTTIEATQGTVSGSTLLTVTGAVLQSIAVSPTNPVIALGTQEPFTALGTYSDRSTQDLTLRVTWSSSAGGVATISNAAGSKGLASSVSTGTTTIGADLEGVNGSTLLTVTAAVAMAIEVLPATATIEVGGQQPFTASGHYSDGTFQVLTTQVTWGSSDGAVATVSNAAGSKGVATGVSPGPATITAAQGILAGSALLTVKSPSPRFVRCDSNSDGRIDLADGVWIVNELFHGGPPALCQKACDCDDNQRVNLNDAVYCFNYELNGGPAPPAPFPACGTDPTEDSLTCLSVPHCP
jgi:hypothetical protein